MAMSTSDRAIALESDKILESFINESDKPRDSILAGKMVDLKDVEKFLEGKEMSYLGLNPTYGASGDVVVGIYLMSTKKVQVPKDRNYLSFGYSFGINDEGNIDRAVVKKYSSTNTSLESFIQLPQANHGADRMSAKDVVKLCDASQIYNLYQDVSLSIMRKLFSHPYHMFTGPDLYKKEEPVDGNTLYVMYDKIRKKFKYSYNPKFILECAIDEWMLQKNSYKSFEDCYTYILAFMITHEMLHIIHHNTLSTGTGDIIKSADHDVSNIVQDSFINCKISRRYIGVDGIKKDDDGIAPIPRIGIGSKITVRAEHNNGLKKFKDERELSMAILDTLKRLLKLDASLQIRTTGLDDSSSLEELAGADVFISIDVSPTFAPIRDNSSNLFQVCIEDILKVITDGKVHSSFSKISDEEKLSDVDKLPIGTLVMVKYTRDIAYVSGYNEDDKIYTLTKAKVSGVKRVSKGNVVLCVTEYSDSGEIYGKRSRIDIKPYNPMDDAYTEDAQTKQDKLSKEDIAKAKGLDDASNKLDNGMPQPDNDTPQPDNDTGGADDMSSDQNMSDDDNSGQPEGDSSGVEDGSASSGDSPDSNDTVEAKNLSVGDIVWIRKLKKFGRIVSVDNGRFSVEEVIEKPSKIIDDSDNYYNDGSEK